MMIKSDCEFYQKYELKENNLLLILVETITLKTFSYGFNSNMRYMLRIINIYPIG